MDLDWTPLRTKLDNFSITKITTEWRGLDIKFFVMERRPYICIKTIIIIHKITIHKVTNSHSHICDRRQP
jgi:hypothetical protein